MTSQSRRQSRSLGRHLEELESSIVDSLRHPYLTGLTEPLKVTSRMARNGIIFSDGIESDYLEFNSGAELTITTAPQKAHLIPPL